MNGPCVLHGRMDCGDCFYLDDEGNALDHDFEEERLRCGECDAVIGEGESHDSECSHA